MNSSLVQTAIAQNAVGVSRFVERDPGGVKGQKVKQGTANCRTIGIGPPYATAAGSPLMYAYAGLEYVTLGGTVVAGDRLKSDSTGQAVAIAVGGTTPQNVGAIATQDGASGDIALVQIEIYTESAGDYLS